MAHTLTHTSWQGAKTSNRTAKTNTPSKAENPAARKRRPDFFFYNTNPTQPNQSNSMPRDNAAIPPLKNYQKLIIALNDILQYNHKLNVSIKPYVPVGFTLI